MKYIIIFCVIFYSTITYAGTRDPNIPDEKYIEFGQKFSCVGEVFAPYKDGLFCGSCVIIDKHHALTSAHIVAEADNSPIIVLDKEPYIIDKVNVSPLYYLDTDADIALLFCKEGFEIDKFPPIYTDMKEKGKICSISGFGLTGTFDKGYEDIDETKPITHLRRAGSNRIDDFDRFILYTSPSLPTDKHHTSLEFAICPRDSGGGLFIDGKLAAINTSMRGPAFDPKTEKTPPTRAKYGETSKYTRVCKFVDWIEKCKAANLTKK